MGREAAWGKTAEGKRRMEKGGLQGKMMEGYGYPVKKQGGTSWKGEEGRMRTQPAPASTPHACRYIIMGAYEEEP